jgi:hypothetical protein
MKHFGYKFGALALSLALGLSLFGCGSNSAALDEAAYGYVGGGGYYEVGIVGGDGAADMDVGGIDGDGGEQTSAIKAGQLTAGAWNDNENYPFFLSLFGLSSQTSAESTVSAESTDSTDSTDSAESEGLFSKYLTDDWGMYATNRVEVEVTGEDGKPAAGATVVLASASETANANDLTIYAQTETGADGKAYLFPKSNVTEYAVYAGYGEELSKGVQADGQEVYTVTLAEESRRFSQIDLCFMIDTTGSMGDELKYLKAETADVISRVQTQFPDADIRLGLVFYRDYSDEYLTRAFDFTSDIESQQSNLAAQSAAGGGDYPEAVQEALSSVLQLSWRADSCKLLVPVLDAPPHDSVTDVIANYLKGEAAQLDFKTEYGSLVYEAAEKGITAIPVAASGVDTLTQYLLRSFALITGGEYVFLTDDSGIGLEHEKPVVGEFTVEYLNSCLVRLISERFDGVSRAAVDYRQER